MTADLSTQDDVVAQVAAKGVEVSGEATFSSLAKKPRRVLNFTVFTSDDAGEQVAQSMRYKALSGREYDDLQAAHPPTSKGKALGQQYNLDTFAPALISAVSVIPKLTYDEAKTIYTSDTWAGGEITALFINALRVCNAGLDVPFNERD
jgi:hypothetical protein